MRGQVLKKVLILTGNAETARELNSALAQKGFACFNADSADIAVEMVKQETLDILLVDADGLSASSWYNLKSEEVPKIKVAAGLPVIALMPKGTLDGIDSAFHIDDFVVRPFELWELVTRIKRIVNRASSAGNQDSIKQGDLLMDVAKCEVSINGRLVALTFKEYELLKFLMGHKGKVFTREALLDRVWGYDYYGGDRTVDVHIRRLRSKIEDVDHTFIETVRNIGYKFIG
jgi:DNA-binding response OmpR family regulator